jgi:hypothetical protein
MNIKTALLGSTALIMTAAERSKGRFMRAPDEHGGAPTPTPTPEATPTPTPSAPELTPEQEQQAQVDALDAEFGDLTPAPELEQQEEVDPNAPKPKTPEERIGEITAEAREAQRQAAEARREADEWRRRAEEAVAPKKGDEGAATDQAPDPEKYDYGEADPKFIADTARFHARQEFAQLQSQAEAKATIADMEAKWQGALSAPEVVEKYPDFKEKVVDTAEAGSWDCTPLMAVGIKASPVGPDVAYHLATNTAEAARIAAIQNPIEQALEFGRLEGRFLHAPKAEASPAKTVTTAPTPPANRARGAGGQFAVAADTDDFASFDKMADGLMKK